MKIKIYPREGKRTYCEYEKQNDIELCVEIYDEDDSGFIDVCQGSESFYYREDATPKYWLEDVESDIKRYRKKRDFSNVKKYSLIKDFLKKIIESRKWAWVKEQKRFWGKRGDKINCAKNLIYKKDVKLSKSDIEYLDLDGKSKYQLDRVCDYEWAELLEKNGWKWTKIK